MVHTRTDLAHIGKADAKFQQRWKLTRFVKARRQADLMDRAPKAIAGVRVVVAHVGRPRTCGGADEDQSQILLKLIRKLFGRTGEQISQHPIARLHLLRIEIHA